jgi:hypothetical protein
MSFPANTMVSKQVEYEGSLWAHPMRCTKDELRQDSTSKPLIPTTNSNLCGTPLNPLTANAYGRGSSEAGRYSFAPWPTFREPFRRLVGIFSGTRRRSDFMLREGIALLGLPFRPAAF